MIVNISSVSSSLVVFVFYIFFTLTHMWPIYIREPVTFKAFDLNAAFKLTVILKSYVIFYAFFFSFINNEAVSS